MIYSIMIGEEIEVYEVIFNEFYKIVEKLFFMVRLVFFYFICYLCYSAGVIIEGDIFIEEDKFIIKKRI
ncbi:hypothetical protein DF186_13915, partial [Enterococcus hirae]